MCMFEVLFVCAMLWCWDNKYVQNHCGQHGLTMWGLQMVCRRELFKQNNPSMPQHGRMAQSLMAIYHLGHPAEFFFRFPFKQFFPCFFPTWFMQQILWPFSPSLSLYFSKYIFNELPEEKCPLFWLKSAAHCSVWINCSPHSFKIIIIY